MTILSGDTAVAEGGKSEEIGIVRARRSLATVRVMVLTHMPHVVVDVDFECGTDFLRLTFDQARALAGLLLEPTESVDSPRELQTVSGATAKAIAFTSAYVHEPLTGLVVDFYPRRRGQRRYTPTLRCVILSPSEVRTLVALLHEAANARTLL